MERPTCCQSRLEASYCTFGCGAIIRRNPHAYRYRVIHCAITNKRTWFSPHGKSNSHLLGGLKYKQTKNKKNRGTITLLHTWPQDGCHNRFPLKFLWQLQRFLGQRLSQTCKIYDGSMWPTFCASGWLVAGEPPPVGSPVLKIEIRD